MPSSSTINETKEEVYSTESDLSRRAHAQVASKPRRLFSHVLLWLFIATMVMASFEWTPLAIAFAHNWQLKRSLEESLTGADRILIGRDNPIPSKELIDAFEIQGTEAVAGFISLIAFDEEPQPLFSGIFSNISTSCQCWGDVQIEFYRRNEKLARIAVAHVDRLKGHDGRWLGDLPLTKKSGSDIAAWLNQHATLKVNSPVNNGP